MSLIDTLDPILQPYAQQLFSLAERAGVRPHITSGRRSRATQEQLYKTFLAGHSHYPAAPPGFSAHEYGLAFDMVVEGSVNQSDCGVVWRSWGGRYGGEEDPVHFEHPAFTGRVGAAGPTPQSTSPTAGSIENRINDLANAVVLGAPTPLRGILNTAEVANEVLAAYHANPYAHAVEWLLTHPAEVTAAFVAAARQALLGR